MAIFRAVVKISDPTLRGTGTNIFHGHVDSDEDNSMGAMMVNLQSKYDAISAIFPSTTTLSWDGTAVTIGSAPALLSKAEDSWSVTGTGGTHPAPPANCIVLGWSTILRTKAGRGRTFLGPLDRDQVQDNGTPYEETRSMLEENFQDLIDDQADSENFFGVYSQLGAGNLRQFKTVKVANRFAVLRSRRD